MEVKERIGSGSSVPILTVASSMVNPEIASKNETIRAAIAVREGESGAAVPEGVDAVPAGAGALTQDPLLMILRGV